MYNLGQVIWDKLYQNYILIVGYNKKNKKYIIDKHRMVEMSHQEIDKFKQKNYNEENYDNLKEAL